MTSRKPQRAPLEGRVEVRLSPSVKDVAQELADALGMDLATYCREQIMKGAAADLERLRPFLRATPGPAPAPVDGYQRPAREPDARYQSSGAGAGLASGSRAGTPRALSGDALDADADASSSSSSGAASAGALVPDDRTPEEIAEDEELLERYVTSELEAAEKRGGVRNPAALAKWLREDALAHPEKVEAWEERQAKAQKRRVGRDPV